ncbi:MAG: LLM class F420-dependent oxidoreductase [Candidatus Bathyarchaeota archaeon]|nr:MAG: LLM class F420-dependent oxidoreductase [Candidatus Bathyarchaeota archaeon]
MSIKFGIQIEPQLGFSHKAVEKIALESEKIGYDSIWSSDHFFLDNKSEDRNCMEAWTLLAALASKTRRIRLGTLVTCNSYRHPAVLAKIAATVDRISNGRLFFGIGAGWKKIEYRAYGIPFPSLKGRMDRLEEAIQIIKLLWTKPKATFKGKYYKIRNAFSAPKPVQEPMPSMMIGGSGEKRTLKMVAKYADYCNLWLSPDLKHKLEVLKRHCEDVGRDYKEVGKSLFAFAGVFVTDVEEELEDHLTRRSKRNNMPIAKLKELFHKDAPGSWVGYPEEVIERFQYLIDLGFDYFQIAFPGIDEEARSASQRFAKSVMKKL